MYGFRLRDGMLLVAPSPLVVILVSIWNDSGGLCSSGVAVRIASEETNTSTSVLLAHVKSTRKLQSAKAKHQPCPHSIHPPPPNQASLTATPLAPPAQTPYLPYPEIWYGSRYRSESYNRHLPPSFRLRQVAQRGGVFRRYLNLGSRLRLRRRA